MNYQKDMVKITKKQSDFDSDIFKAAAKGKLTSVQWLAEQRHADVKKRINMEIISNSEKETIELGKSYSVDESCLSSKIYLGHVANLIDKCDIIIICKITF